VFLGFDFEGLKFESLRAPSHAGTGFQRIRLSPIASAAQHTISEHGCLISVEGQVSTLLPRAVDDGGRSYPT
jgi:hypothetical protein